MIMCVCVCVCMCVCACVCACMRACVCAFAGKMTTGCDNRSRSTEMGRVEIDGNT